ncbi:MAG TPA: amino acid adenylation domain-containing protein, partial [Thermoanaerobaculia bacterium]|nr:amino acid adenylation domain-containing protein [Thermoanaerobaculia bacterium]
MLTGLVANGRPEVEDGERALGLFLNTLPLRLRLAAGSWADLARAAFAAELAALPHRRLPLAEIQRRESAGAPLFEAIFNYIHFHALEALAATPRIEVLAARTAAETHYPLVVHLSRAPLGGGELAVFLQYDPSRLHPAQGLACADLYVRALEALAQDPELPWSAVLLNDAERHQLVVEWNAGRAGPDGLAGAVGMAGTAPCLHELFAAQAARTPQAVAVVCEGEHLSYGALAARAGRLAARLRRLGVGAETRVGLCVERSLAMVEGIVGILAAGGAYVPLDPAYPEERLRFILDDAGLRVLLTQRRLRGALPALAAATAAPGSAGASAGGVLVIELDGGEGTAATSALASTATATATAAASAGNLAYVIYTSGSTGRPKGVGISHGNVTRLFAVAAELFDFGREDVWTLFHSHAFDFSVWELWGALLHGGRLVVVPYWVSRSPAAFRELLARERVSVLNQTPSAFRQLAAADGEAPAGEALSLRWVVFGGEALDPRSLSPWFARHGDAVPRLVNMYGITETTVHVTFRRLLAEDAGTAGWGAPSVIGRALPDLSLAVLDREREPVPVGVAGELQVGGAGVARGYLGRPELTAERFVPDPWGRAGPGSRLYRSGDLARYLANGDLEYLGRTDHQVKVRGFRIELGEIEAALAEHPAVGQAAVVARRDGDPGSAAGTAAAGAAGAAGGSGAGSEPRLVAYFVAAPAAGAPPGLEELRGWLRQRLPEHMLPAAFVALPALPLTAHGKIDRAALPAPEQGRSELAGAYVAPRPGVERELAEIWEQVLRQERVGAADSFFALGGDSILSIRVRALAGERGLHFELQDLFQHDTVGELARVARRAAAEAAPALAPFALLAAADRERLPAEVEDAFPPSLLQLGMLFHSQREASSTAYHNVSSFVLRGTLAPRALAAAVRRLGARHPLLRTAFDDLHFTEPLALVYREARIPLAMVDLRGLPPAARELAMAARFAAERRRRFDWRRPPLLRLWVSALAADSFELGVAEHHAIVDGWSYATLLAELFTLYFAELGWGPEPAAAPGAVFRGFVALERQAMASAASRRYWHEALAGHAFLALPRWPRRAAATPAAETGEAGVEAPAAGAMREHTRLVPAATVAALGRAAAALGVPQKSLLFAVHLRVMALLGGSGPGGEVLTGLVANGRPEVEDGERALGLFLNTLPLRLRLAA